MKMRGVTKRRCCKAFRAFVHIGMAFLFCIQQVFYFPSLAHADYIDFQSKPFTPTLEVTDESLELLEPSINIA